MTYQAREPAPYFFGWEFHTAAWPIFLCLSVCLSVYFSFSSVFCTSRKRIHRLRQELGFGNDIRKPLEGGEWSFIVSHCLCLIIVRLCPDIFHHHSYKQVREGLGFRTDKRSVRSDVLLTFHLLVLFVPSLTVWQANDERRTHFVLTRCFRICTYFCSM